MSTVFLHVGQCGNQVAQSFWRKIAKDEEISQRYTGATDGFLYVDLLKSVTVVMFVTVLSRVLLILSRQCHGSFTQYHGFC